jgi:curved DNA-binding protein CbpA
MPKDYYLLLEVDSESTTEQIKKAYRQKARKLHPDVNPGVSHALFIELQEAFAVLADPQKRMKYDLSRKYSPLNISKNEKEFETNTVFYAFDPENKNDFQKYHRYYKEFKEEWSADSFYNPEEALLLHDSEKDRPRLNKFLSQIKKEQSVDENIIHNYDFIIGSISDLSGKITENLNFIQKILEHGAICFIKENLALWPDDSIEDYCDFYLALYRQFPAEIHSIPEKKYPESELEQKNLPRIRIIQIMHNAIIAGAGNGDLIVLFREILPFRTTIKIAEMLRTIKD